MWVSLCGTRGALGAGRFAEESFRSRLFDVGRAFVEGRCFALSGLCRCEGLRTQGGGLRSLGLAWPCPGLLNCAPSELGKRVGFRWSLIVTTLIAVGLGLVVWSSSYVRASGRSEDADCAVVRCGQPASGANGGRGTVWCTPLAPFG